MIKNVVSTKHENGLQLQLWEKAILIVEMHEAWLSHREVYCLSFDAQAVSGQELL
jgi:hypothetical protein